MIQYAKRTLIVFILALFAFTSVNTAIAQSHRGRGFGIIVGQQSAAGGGVEINEVVKGGPAEKAKILDGDVILEVDGKKVDSGERLISVVRDIPPSQTFALVYLRRSNVSKYFIVNLIDLAVLQRPVNADTQPIAVEFDEFYAQYCTLSGGLSAWWADREIPADTQLATLAVIKITALPIEDSSDRFRLVATLSPPSKTVIDGWFGGDLTPVLGSQTISMVGGKSQELEKAGLSRWLDKEFLGTVLLLPRDNCKTNAVLPTAPHPLIPGCKEASYCGFHPLHLPLLMYTGTNPGSQSLYFDILRIKPLREFDRSYWSEILSILDAFDSSKEILEHIWDR